MALSKLVVRGGLVGALILGAGLVVAGPDRIRAVFTQTQSAVNDAIDSQIKDPVALRQQIRTLAEQYPKRIADLRGDLAQLKTQQAQLTRDLAVSNRVVEMAESDYDTLAAGIDQGNAATIQQTALGQEHQVVIAFKNEKIPLSAAQTKISQVAATRTAYAGRAADIQRDLGYLSQQEITLTQLVSKLEQEQTAFQTQMFDLDRQIDAIGRNDRMIAIMSDRQRALDEQTRYRAASLDQITGKLADIRARQEAQLSHLGKLTDRTQYEDAAKTALDREAAMPSARKVQEVKPKANVIEIDPTKLPKSVPTIAPAEKAAGPIASRD
jgi:chromosome segregation ATPase